MNENTELLMKALSRTKQEVAKVIIGHDAVVDQALIAILNGAHSLVEGVPGVVGDVANEIDRAAEHRL